MSTLAPSIQHCSRHDSQGNLARKIYILQNGKEEKMNVSKDKPKNIEFYKL